MISHWTTMTDTYTMTIAKTSPTGTEAHIPLDRDLLTIKSTSVDLVLIPVLGCRGRAAADSTRDNTAAPVSKPRHRARDWR